MNKDNATSVELLKCWSIEIMRDGDKTWEVKTYETGYSSQTISGLKEIKTSGSFLFDMRHSYIEIKPRPSKRFLYLSVEDHVLYVI
jgi:hypothetical protein